MVGIIDTKLPPYNVLPVITVIPLNALHNHKFKKHKAILLNSHSVTHLSIIWWFIGAVRKKDCV